MNNIYVSYLLTFLRGFAFVVFKTVDGLKDAVATEEHAVKVTNPERRKILCFSFNVSRARKLL